MRGLFVFLAVAASTISAPARGGQFQDLAELDSRVVASLQGVGTAVPIDRRIRLAQCRAVPEISAPANGTVAVRCPDQGWRLAVAISGAGSSAISQEILIHRGDTIEVLARGSGFTVSTSGVAMDEGQAGKTVRVKMLTSSAPITASVVRPGVVAISF